MKTLKFASFLTLVLAAASLASAQSTAPTTVNNVLFKGKITSSTGGAPAMGNISSLLSANGVDYTLQADGSLSDPVPFEYSRKSDTTATLAENASGALPGVQVALTFTSASAGTFAATYDGGSTQAGTFSLLPIGLSVPLVNVSALTAITGGEAAITGFVISGKSPQRILVRAIGPTLSQYGVAGPLSNPVVTLWQGASSIASNDDWSSGTTPDSTLSAAFSQVGAFALTSGSKDAALVITLSPGVYTAQVRGTGASDAGKVLMEVYLIQ